MFFGANFLSLGDQKKKPMQLQQRILSLGGKTGPHLPYFKGKIKQNKI
jgi:hypothetical protein